MTSLYDPIDLGGMKLSNRVFMAPLTRNRATPSGVPGRLAATYYSQRASAGLIVTEATQISPMGKGYINTPGIHSEEEAAGWKTVVDAVHHAGGRIFLELWHVGRISHGSLLPGNTSPVAPSAIRGGRVGVRISPLGTFNDMGDATPEETFARVVDVLNGHQLGYLHVVEDPIPADQNADFYRRLRSAWRGVYLAHAGYDAERGERAIADGSADAVAYGRLFLTNPDLPARLRRRGPLNAPDQKSFYGGNEHGYIDYPARAGSGVTNE